MGTFYSDLDTIESNIRGTDNDDLKNLSDEAGTIETKVDNLNNVGTSDLGFTVQSGRLTSAAEFMSETQAISAVTIANAYIVLNSYTTSNDYPNNTIKATFNSTTEILFERDGMNDQGTSAMFWQVIESTS